MSAEYIIEVADLQGKRLGDIPASQPEYSDNLNASGAITFKLPLTHPKATEELLALGQRELHVWRENAKVWGGYLWRDRIEGENVVFGGEGWLSMLRKRFIDETLTFTDEEQFEIAWQLIEFTQAKDDGDLRIRRHSLDASGITRTRTYPELERKPIAEALGELAATQDGFDFQITPDKLWKTFHPHKGRRLKTIVFDLAKNITDTENFEGDASGLATELVAYGEDFQETDGTASIRLGVATDAVARARFGLLQETVALRDVPTQALIDAHAAEQLRLRKEIRRNPGITVRADDPPVGSYGVGDSVRVIVKRGYQQLDRFMRITSKRVLPDDDGAEVANLTFDEEVIV